MFRTSLILMLLLLTLSACGGSKKQLGSPKQTFEKLVDAIQHKDLESYKACWYSERAQGEGMVSQLEVNPEAWDELQALFRGPQTLKVDGETQENGLLKKRFSVEAPEAKEGGIGSISMVQEDGVWKMYHW